MKSITKEQWYKHPSYMQDLQAILANPVLQVALEIVEDQVRKSTLTPTGIDLVQFFAIMGAKKDGGFETLENLRSLARPEVMRRPEDAPWTSPRKPSASSPN